MRGGQPEQASRPQQMVNDGADILQGRREERLRWWTEIGQREDENTGSGGLTR